MKTPGPFLLVATALFLLHLAVPVLAGDGVLEIHQACVATGCFTGDTAGYPVTIANPGSYRLTSNLALPNENTTGIEITAFGVALDLGGFVIEGATSCSWDDPGGGPPAVVCSPTGTGKGIHATERARVGNGWIRGVGGEGVYLEKGGEVSGMTLHETGSYGIRGGSHELSLCRGNHIELTGGSGIWSEGLAEGNILKRIGSSGIFATNMHFNDVSSTVGDALVVGAPWGRVDGNTVYASSGYCVRVPGATATIHSNVLRSCGGIDCTDASSSQLAGCTVTGNTMTRSGMLYLSPSSGYGNNILYDNNGGNTEPQVSGGHEIATNVCGDDTTCP